MLEDRDTYGVVHFRESSSRFCSDSQVWMLQKMLQQLFQFCAVLQCCQIHPCTNSCSKGINAVMRLLTNYLLHLG